MEAREKQNSEGVAYYTMQTQWLPKFLLQNYDWIKAILKPFVAKKKQIWEEFLEHVVTADYKCDEVGLFLFARMFHIQIGVIVNGVAWTTHFKQDLKQCDIVYKGYTRVAVSLFYCKNWNQVKLCKMECHLMLSKSPRIVHLHPSWQSQKFNANQLI